MALPVPHPQAGTAAASQHTLIMRPTPDVPRRWTSRPLHRPGSELRRPRVGAATAVPDGDFDIATFCLSLDVCRSGPPLLLRLLPAPRGSQARRPGSFFVLLNPGLFMYNSFSIGELYVATLNRCSPVSNLLMQGGHPSYEATFLYSLSIVL